MLGEPSCVPFRGGRGEAAITSNACSAGGWAPGATTAGWRATGGALDCLPTGFHGYRLMQAVGWVLYLYCLLGRQWALGIGAGGGHSMQITAAGGSSWALLYQ